ncbi:hypothetical protein FHL15_007461 [Xylaria flabelliformis]|uniref:Fucose-specific lectin n=1 Tax=Xylaria flabelliformis TaxID=2512241 RepID=A0A553HUQ5_9PEZI|nr:hypothetical protein FHL15_007461 [Xylaria flabelliformis]
MELDSGLEVVPNERRAIHQLSYHLHPEAVPNDYGTTLPEATPLEHRADGIQDVRRSDDGIQKSWRNLAFGGEQKERKYRFPIRMIYLISIAFILILGAIAGGVAGGIKSSANKSTPPMNSNVTHTPNVNILAESKLSATNWTDLNGFTHRFVFFQDTFNALVARRWDSQNHTWTTNNLTDILSSTRTPLNPLRPSTPLASVASYFQNITNSLNLYFVATNNIITGVAVFDLLRGPNNWVLDSTLGEGPALLTSPGSQLAAMWNRCSADDCVGWWALAYQGLPDADVNVVNSSDWKSPYVAQSRVAQNSSLAMIPEIDYEASSLTSISLMSESLTTSNLGSVRKTAYVNQAKGWVDAGPLLHDISLPGPSPTLQFAISTLDHFESPVFLCLLPNGTVTGEYWRSGFVSIHRVEFRGGPDTVNFSAIAASEEAMFYGVSNDEILQYSITATDPSIFQFVERVYP